MNIHPFTVLLNSLQAWATHGGYLFLFLASILEAVPLIGSAIPGHTIVILSGFLAKLGLFNLWIVMIIASVGAIIGDALSFYIGRIYGIKFIERYKNHFFFKHEYMEKARRLIGKHTGKALFIGRFNPITRSYMPLLVGASNTRSWKFWVYDIIACIVWAVSSVLIGYIFGIGYHTAAKSFGQAVIVVAIVAVIAIWGYSLVNRYFHVFKKYELFILALNILSLWGLVETMQDAWSAHSYMTNFDVWVNMFMANHVTPVVVATAEFMSTVGSAAITGILGLTIGAWFLIANKWRSAAIMVFSILSTTIAVELLKALFMRARPVNALDIIVNDPSFPSGHAALAAAFFTVVAYLLAPRISSWLKRELIILACFAAAFLIGLSRIILAVHWTSDVLAGWSLGIFLATATIMIVRYISGLYLNKLKHVS